MTLIFQSQLKPSLKVGEILMGVVINEAVLAGTVITEAATICNHQGIIAATVYHGLQSTADYFIYSLIKLTGSLVRVVNILCTSAQSLTCSLGAISLDDPNPQFFVVENSSTVA